MKKIFLLLPIFLFLTACSTTQMKIKQPTFSGASYDNPVIAIGQFEDKREHAPNWLGAIRGGFGNPLKTLETEKPVKEVVRDAFAGALRQRGLLASPPSSAKYRLDVSVIRYDCNQYVRREAHVKLGVSLLDTRNNQIVFSDQIVVDKVEGSMLSLKSGIFASLDDLKGLAERTLFEAMDKLFAKSEFQRFYR